MWLGQCQNSAATGQQCHRPAPCDLSFSLLSSRVQHEEEQILAAGLCWSSWFLCCQAGRRLSRGIPTHWMDLSRAEHCTAGQKRQSLSESTDVPQEGNQNSLFSVFHVAVWQVLVMLCHTDLSGLVSVVCTSPTERSLCLYTHRELNLTCCTGLFKIYFPEVRMTTLSGTEIIPSIKCPCGEVCHSYVKQKNPGFASADVKASRNSSLWN